MEALKEQTIITMASSGFSVKDIANEVEVSESTVRSVLKLHNIELKDAPPKLNEREQNVIEAYKGDTPVPQILQQFEFTYTKLYTLLERTKTPLRKSHALKARETMIEQAVKMYEEGTPLWKITQETGVAQPKLHAELHLRNIPLRRPRS